jgi:sugar lactone lactonase YvrE
VTDLLELIVDAHAELGEGPVWDDREQRLWWIDLLGGIVHVTNPLTRADTRIPVGQPIGALALTESGPPLLAVRDGYASVDPSSGRLDLIAPVAQDDPDIRMNDGKVGPDGGFWAGSMAVDESPDRGALHRLDPDGTVTAVLTGLTIPNGLDWSADGRELLFIDTPTRRVDRFDVGPTGRTLSGRRPVVEIAQGSGWPDGMTLDSEGFLWVCMWDGWAIERFAPDGRMDRRVEIPAAQVTSCTFGGPDLDDLFITTGQEGFPPGGRPDQPHAGGLFRYRAGVRGRPTRRFQGSTKHE